MPASSSALTRRQQGVADSQALGARLFSQQRFLNSYVQAGIRFQPLSNRPVIPVEMKPQEPGIGLPGLDFGPTHLVHLPIFLEKKTIDNAFPIY